MENVIAKRIKNVKLTKAQQKIAEFFIQNSERVGISSSMEVAKEIGVSDASITRFARAIGYEGFTELKNDIYSNLAMQATGGVNSLSLTERLDHSNMQYGKDRAMVDFFKLTEYNLERTFQQNKSHQFENVVSMLLNATHRYIIGFRGCAGSAAHFSYVIRLLLEHVICITEEGPGCISNLQDIGSDDCVVLFSLSRYYKVDLKLATLAKKRGAKVCLVTNNLLSPLSDLADVLLLVESKPISYFNSVTSINLISEYLLTRIVQKRADHYRDRATERDELTQDLRL